MVSNRNSIEVGRLELEELVSSSFQSSCELIIGEILFKMEKYSCQLFHR